MSGPSHQQEQAERKSVIEAEAKTNTLHGRTAFEVAADQQGRWTRETTIIGQQAAALYPKLPASNSSNQQANAVGPEPALGIDVNAMEPVGTYSEVMASIDALNDGPESLSLQGSALGTGARGEHPNLSPGARHSSPMQKRKI